VRAGTVFPPVIRVENLVRRYGVHTAVDGVSFAIERGEAVGLLGVNGAGKTTTLRVLTGYLPATSGLVEVAGFDVLRDSLRVRQRIGYLPESVPLYREHRVREMLAFHGRLFGLRGRELKTRAAAVLERVELGERARSLIGDLSKGLRQRVGIALALLPDPEVLILDEPTSGLDPLQRLELRRLVQELARQRTVLISSHILPEIEATVERVLILHRGRLVADGTPAALVERSGTAHVRLEAVVGADREAAERMLGALRGASSVRHVGRRGIHDEYEIACAEDLREDVGALAMARRWALRELSYRRPTLEQIFAEIALEYGAPRAGAGQAAPSVENAEPSNAGLVRLAAAPGAPDATGPAAAPARRVYNLNTFELGPGGSVRDLSQPKTGTSAPPGDPSSGDRGARAPEGAR
jgi:ABC-2 type transport system ATP-binding protein